MKILIAADMEGISGATSWSHVSPANSEYVRFRRIMTADVNAAIAGAFDGGADEVMVSDGHNAGHNLMVELLDPRAQLNAGNAAPHSMMSGIELRPDACMFIGYHARAGTQQAALNHTWDLHIANLWLNDILVGEAGLNAALAGVFHAPLLLVSGDQALAAEVRAIIPGVESVVVKQSTSGQSAECLHPSVAQEKIRSGAALAVKRFANGSGPHPFSFNGPVTVTLEFTQAIEAARSTRLPGVHRLESKKVQFVAADMLQAYRAFRTMETLAQG